MRRGGNWWFKISIMLVFLTIFDNSLTHTNLGWEELTLKHNCCYGWLFFYSYFWMGASVLGVIYAFIVFFLSCGLFSGGGGVTLLLLFSLELKTHLLSSFHSLPTSDSNFIINVLLTNRLNYVHPPLFFIAILIIIWSLLHSGLIRFTPLMYYFGHILVKNHIWNEKEFTFVLSPLIILGGWWAYQEGNWGGWWNWDPSETFALLLATRVLFYWHNYTPVTCNAEKLLSGLNNIIMSFWIFLFIQINFLIVSHNFGLRFLSLFTSNTPLFWGILSLLYIYFLILNLQTSLFRSRWEGIFFKKNLTWIIYTFGAFYISYSFISIFAYFSWNVSEIVVSSSSFSILTLNASLSALLLFSLLRFTKGLLFTNWFLFGEISQLATLSLLLRNSNSGFKLWLFYIHLFVLFVMWWCVVGNSNEHWFAETFYNSFIYISWNLFSNFDNTFSRWNMESLDTPTFNSLLTKSGSHFFFFWDQINHISGSLSIQGISRHSFGDDIISLALLPLLIWVVVGSLLRRR